MAVPKKRTSKSKKNLRKTVWKQKAIKQAVKAFFIATKASKKGNLEKVITADGDSET